MSFHINSHGEAGKCKAQAGNCPFGGADEHYKSAEEARSAYETAQELQATQGLRKTEKLAPEVEASLERLEKLVNNPARSYFGFPEDEMVRANIESSIRTERDNLKKLHPQGDLLYLSTVVHTEDREAGVQAVAKEMAVANPEAYGWKALMGSTRRSVNTVDQYTEAVERKVSQDAELADKIEAAAAKHRDSQFFSRAYTSKIDVPEPYDKEFEAIWNSPYQGGERWILNEIHENKKQIEGLRSGELSPKDIRTEEFPKGVSSKAAARNALYYRTSYLQHAVRTHGRSYSSTIKAVTTKMRKEGHESKLPRPLSI